MSWDDLCGERKLNAFTADVRHPFDADANGCALDLGDMTVFVFENPNDGYRSSAIEPMIVKAALYEFKCDPDYIRVPCLIRRQDKGRYGGAFDGVEVIDTRNGKTILLLGTDNNDDYYPSYTCEWSPQNIYGSAP